MFVCMIEFLHVTVYISNFFILFYSSPAYLCIPLSNSETDQNLEWKFIFFMLNLQRSYKIGFQGSYTVTHSQQHRWAFSFCISLQTYDAGFLQPMMTIALDQIVRGYLVIVMDIFVLTHSYISKMSVLILFLFSKDALFYLFAWVLFVSKTKASH